VSLNKVFFATVMPLILISCGGGDGDSTAATTTTDSTSGSEVYPTDLTVSSPTNTGSSSTTPFLAPSAKSVAKAFSTEYTVDTEKVDALLTGLSTFKNNFDPAKLQQPATDANCFGPQLIYSNHPDGSPDTSPLPSGDLGIWLTSETTVGSTFRGNGCAVAQLNSRMEDIKLRVSNALTALAGIVGAIKDGGLSFPEDGEEISVVDALNALNVEATTFDSVSIGKNGATFTYQIALTYTDPNDSTDISRMFLQLKHAPGTDENNYKGLLSYRIEDQFSGGNCPVNASSRTDVTYIGSLRYDRDSATVMNLQLKNGAFCGLTGTSEDATNKIGIDDDGITDASQLFDATTKLNGWADNFSIFTANFNPSNAVGSYSYAWQAGKDDSHSRVFNIQLNEASPVTVKSYYGFGDQVTATNGSIKGFICNWSGPGNNHTTNFFDSLAQKQLLQFDETTKRFLVTGENLIYAPTNSCTYDGSGTFLYDRDLDQDLLNETAATVNVGLGETLVLDLLTKSSTTANITETITEEGYIANSTRIDFSLEHDALTGKYSANGIIFLP
jgi:hypothetical protein